MTPVPARGRRSLTSLLLGALAMAGSFTVMGALVLSDVADASAPETPKAELLTNVEQQAEMTPPTVPNESAEPGFESPKPQAKKRPKKKVDFGRFEGY